MYIQHLLYTGHDSRCLGYILNKIDKDPSLCGHYILVVLFAFSLNSFPTLFSTAQKYSLSLDMILIVS